MEGAFWGIGAALGFGTGDFIARFTSRSIGAEASLLATVLIGFLGLSVWLFWPGSGYLEASDFHGWLTGSGLFLSMGCGAANVFGLLALYKALARGPVSLAAPIVAAYPAVVLLYLIPLGFVPGLIHLFGIITTLGGVAILSYLAEAEQPQVAPATPNTSAAPKPQQGHGKTIRLSIYAMCGVALGVFLSQEVSLLHGSLLSVWSMRAFGTFWLLLWFMFYMRKSVPVPPKGIRLALVAQAILEAGGAICLLLASEGGGRPLAAVFASTFAVVVVLLGWIVLRERITPVQWLAMAVILLGVVTLSAAAPMAG